MLLLLVRRDSLVERKAVGKSVIVAGGWRLAAGGVSLGSFDGRLEG
jgi:hypothetical protein